MFNKTRFKFFLKLIFFLIIIFLVMKFISSTLSRYKSTGASEANADIAFFLVGDASISQTVKVSNIIPRTEPYTYTIVVENNDGTNRAETDIEYNLILRTTTNLPLTYRVYLNNVYTDSGALNIINENNVMSDINGTYFRYITLPTETLSYTEDETNTYQLVIDFPLEYNIVDYKDIMEFIEVTVDAKQKM